MGNLKLAENYFLLLISSSCILMISWFKPWIRSGSQWLSLVTKSACPLCQRPTDTFFCVDCQRQVTECRLSSPGWQAGTPMPVFAWGVYQGALKRSIAALKYHHHPQLAVPLGTWMAVAWNQHPERYQSAIVVPIPVHPAKQKERGFNQAELLAKSFCAMTGLPLRSQGLVRQRETEAQFRLGGTARSQNVKGAFDLGQPFAQKMPDHPVLLVDDIFTTGATAQAAAQTLRSHGIRVRGMVVLAISKFPLK